MKIVKNTFILIPFFLLAFAVVKAQNPTVPAIESLAGTVEKTDETGEEIVIKTQSGEQKSFKIFSKTSFLRIGSDEKNLEKAERIALKDVVPGNRILARGTVSAQTKSFLAQTVIVIRNLASKESKQIQGRVTFIDVSKKEIKISDSSPTETKNITIDASSPNIGFKRYAYKSLKFNDSISGTFEQIKIGDSLKSLGNFDDKNPVFKPEVLVSGTFRTVGGKITALDLKTSEITLVDIQTNQPLKLKIMDDVRLKKITKEVENRIIDIYFKKPTAEKKDFAKNFYDDLSDVSTADLKVGDSIIISTVVDDKNNPVAASSVLTGTDGIFKVLSERQKKSRQPINLGSINL